MTHPRLLIYFFIFLLTACAKVGFPPGGPEDRTPPEIVRTIPRAGETLVDPHASVQVWFSEGIHPSSALDAIFITPYPGERVKYKWRGRKLRIVFPEPLKLERTYVVTFGTGIKDFRNNPMESSFSLAFSTGSVLDEGEMKGRVYGLGDGRGVDVWAYRIEDEHDPDPSKREPDYIVQCAAGGEFLFSHLSPGLYRLFAIRDRVSDRLYQPGEDEVGVTFKDVSLSREGFLRADSLYFRMTQEDTAGPSLIRATPLDRHHLTLRFDEPIFSREGFSADSLMIVSLKDSLDTLFVRQAYLDPTNNQILHVLTWAQDGGRRYRVTSGGIRDEAGNSMDSEYKQALFDGMDGPDTTRPKLIQTVPRPGDRTVGVDVFLRLIFDEPMDSTRFPEGFSLADTLEQWVEGTYQWENPSEVAFVPGEPLRSLTIYRVELLGRGVTDLAGNSLVDTLFQFQTLDVDTLSEIKGRVLDPKPEASGNIHVFARLLNRHEIEYTQVLSTPGEYHFKNVLPGQYLLEVFRDEDENGEFSFGKAFPYQPCERFYVYQDTVKVRSRWPNEGNDLRLP